MKIQSIFFLLLTMSCVVHASKRPADEFISNESKRIALPSEPEVLSQDDLNQGLAQAIEERDLQIAQQYIEQGADVNAIFSDPFQGPISFLHQAIEFGDEEMVRLLINKGASIDFICPERGSALHLVAATGHARIARILLSAGANVHSVHWGTPLHVAAQEGDTVVARLLLEAGANCNAVDNINHATPLHVVRYHLEVASLLMLCGANLEALDGQGNTPFKCAEQGRYARLIALFKSSFLEFCQNPVSFFEKKHTQEELNQLLCYAAYTGLNNCVNALIEHGASIYCLDESKRSLLDLSVKSGNAAQVDSLMKNAFFRIKFEEQHEAYKDQKNGGGLLANQLLTLKSLTCESVEASSASSPE